MLVLGPVFFVTETLIATNIHCIAGATSVLALHSDSNAEYELEGVVAFDVKNDLVILKVSGKGTPFSIGNSDLVEKREIVKAVGCPTGNHVTAEGTFHSTWNNGQWLQTTAKTGDGYSGGPLLNSEGQVIGINFGSGNYYSAAISSNILNELLTQQHTIEHLAQWQKREQISAYDYLVKSKVKNKNHESAIADLDKTIQLNPDYIIAYYNRGTTKGNLAQSKYEEGNVVEAQQLRQNAIDDFSQVIRLCPDYAEAYNNRGLAKSHIGKSKTKNCDLVNKLQVLQSSIDDFTQAIRICPDYAPAYNNRANAKLHLAKSKAESGNMEQSQEVI